jgi:hypothetical protein
VEPAVTALPAAAFDPASLGSLAPGAPPPLPVPAATVEETAPAAEPASPSARVGHELN